MQPSMVMDRLDPAIGEQRLVERARAGDVHAYDALVASRLGPTYRLVKAILGDAATPTTSPRRPSSRPGAPSRSCASSTGSMPGSGAWW